MVLAKNCLGSEAPVVGQLTSDITAVECLVSDNSVVNQEA